MSEKRHELKLDPFWDAPDDGELEFGVTSNVINLLTAYIHNFGEQQPKRIREGEKIYQRHFFGSDFKLGRLAIRQLDDDEVDSYSILRVEEQREPQRTALCVKNYEFEVDPSGHRLKNAKYSLQTDANRFENAGREPAMTSDEVLDAFEIYRSWTAFGNRELRELCGALLDFLPGGANSFDNGRRLGIMDL